MRLPLGDVHVRDADRGRAVAGRIGQLHRGFVAGHQALVAVGGRVGEGVDRLGVLDDAADVPQAHVRQAGVLVAGEQRLAVLPDRLVHVHARAVVAEHRLGHEGGRLAVGVGHVVDHVLIELQAVGHGRAWSSNFRPSSCWAGATSWWCFSGFMPSSPMTASISPRRSWARVDRVDREVAALGARAVAHVAFGIFLAGVDRQLGGVVGVAGVVRLRSTSARRRR